MTSVQDSLPAMIAIAVALVALVTKVVSVKREWVKVAGKIVIVFGRDPDDNRSGPHKESGGPGDPDTSSSPTPRP